MRIAMFSDTWLPTIDGVVTSLLPVRKELERRGHEVFVFAPGDDEAIAANGDDRVILCRGRDFRGYPEYHISLARMKVRKQVRDRSIDIVHSHSVALMGMRAVWAARTNRLPLVFTYHTRVDQAAGYISPPGRPQRIMERLIKTHVNWYLRRAEVVIAPGDATAGHLKEVHGANIRRMETVPNGLDLERFTANPSPTAIGRFGLHGSTIFLTVGRIAKEKCLDTLIAAAPRILREVPGARFVVVGKGPAREHYEEAVRAVGLGGAFLFTGYLDDASVAGFYANAHAFLMPSRLETQAMVVLEAMHYGLPVICADAGGMRDYVRDGVNGYLYEPGNADALATQALKGLRAPPALRAKAGDTARAFTVPKAVDRLLEIYASLMPGKRHPPPILAQPFETKA